AGGLHDFLRRHIAHVSGKCPSVSERIHHDAVAIAPEHVRYGHLLFCAGIDGTLERAINVRHIKVQSDRGALQGLRTDTAATLVLLGDHHHRVTDDDLAMQEYTVHFQAPMRHLHGIERLLVEVYGGRRVAADNVRRHRVHTGWNRPHGSTVVIRLKVEHRLARGHLERRGKVLMSDPPVPVLSDQPGRHAHPRGFYALAFFEAAAHQAMCEGDITVGADTQIVHFKYRLLVAHGAELHAGLPVFPIGLPAFELQRHNGVKSQNIVRIEGKDGFDILAANG